MVKRFIVTIFDVMNFKLKETNNPVTVDSLLKVIMEAYPTDDRGQEFEVDIREEKVVSIVSANITFGVNNNGKQA